MSSDEVKTMSHADGRSSLSVVVPVYNEHEVLPEFHRRLGLVLEGLGLPAEVRVRQRWQH